MQRLRAREEQRKEKSLSSTLQIHVPLITLKETRQKDAATSRNALHFLLSAAARAPQLDAISSPSADQPWHRPSGSSRCRQVEADVKLLPVEEERRCWARCLVRHLVVVLGASQGSTEPVSPVRLREVSSPCARRRSSQSGGFPAADWQEKLSDVSTDESPPCRHSGTFKGSQPIKMQQLSVTGGHEYFHTNPVQFHSALPPRPRQNKTLFLLRCIDRRKAVNQKAANDAAARRSSSSWMAFCFPPLRFILIGLLKMFRVTDDGGAAL